MVYCLERGANTHCLLLHLNPDWFCLLVPACLGSPGQMAVKQVCVCVNSLFSRITWVSQYQKGKTSLDINDARDDGVWGWQWHQLDHMETICTSLQTDNHTNSSSFFRGRMIFLMPNQQCQSTESN